MLLNELVDYLKFRDFIFPLCFIGIFIVICCILKLILFIDEKLNDLCDYFERRKNDKDV